MKNPTKNDFFRKIAGIFLIIIGIAGLVLPGIQGIAFIIIGASLLGNKTLLKKLKKLKAYFQKKR